MNDLEILNGSILPVFPGRLTLTALTISAPMRFEEWEEILHRLMIMNECSGWWLGDALLYGESTYGEKYSQAVEVTGKSYQTLANYVFVCRAIPQEERREDLTFSHHAEVAGIKDPLDRALWLAKAASEDWSVSALRRARQEARETVQPDVPPSPSTLSTTAILGAIAIADEETKQKIRDLITPEMMFAESAAADSHEIENGENELDLRKEEDEHPLIVMSDNLPLLAGRMLETLRRVLRDPFEPDKWRADVYSVVKEIECGREAQP